MDPLLFSTVPANSIVLLTDNQRSGYLSKMISAPEKIRDVAFSDDTGAYTRGIAKGYKLAPEDAPKIALSILEVLIGNKNISDLSALITQKTGISNDIALKIASEIDQDLFAPIQSDLDTFWAQQSSPKVAAISTPPTKQTGSLPKQAPQKENTQPRTPNVLNLKELNARPEEKELSAKPMQKKIGTGNRTVDLKNNRQAIAPPYEGGARGGSSPKPTAPLPPPLTPPRAGGETRRFPLPPSHR